MSSELNGKVALVTGASRGLGEGAARALAAAGAAVMLVARDGALAGSVAREIVAAGGARRSARLRCRGLCRCRAARGRHQRHAWAASTSWSTTPASSSRSPRSPPPIRRPGRSNIQINLIGAYHVVRAVLAGMLAKGGGTIVNVSSGAAYRPLEGWSAYCAGKAGLAMLTSSIALETAGKGIRIFGFSPGTIDTDMQVKIRASGINMISHIPRGDLSPVEHAVRGLLYFCNPPATT